MCLDRVGMSNLVQKSGTFSSGKENEGQWRIKCGVVSSCRPQQHSES